MLENPTRKMPIAIQTNFLSHLEEVLHGTAQLVENSDDVASLHASLGLDELGKLLRLHEVFVIDCLGKPFAVSG